MKENSNSLKRKIIEIVYITLGVAITSMAFSFFISPNNIVTGGVSGVGVILKGLFENFNPALSILIANIVLLLIGLAFLGKDFFIKTAYGSIMFPIFIALFDFIYLKLNFNFKDLDMVLIILFSSIIMGAGLGVVVKHGATTGGTEVIQKILFKFFHMPFSISIYILDGLVILAGFSLGISDLETFLYAIVFTYICGFVIDIVVFSGFNRRAVYIISSKAEEIKHELLYKFERGVTSIKAVGEYSKQDKTMLMCVLNSNEYFKLRSIVDSIDETAFMFAVRASEVRGEGFTYD
jgi:uncharacterized membrane-anchored protein YitT (DUF2179 family)